MTAAELYQELKKFIKEKYSITDRQIADDFNVLQTEAIIRFVVEGKLYSVTVEEL